MPEIQAFRGIRYNLGRVGSLSDVVTPPYDVIGPELQEHFYQLHPNSFIRIDLNRIEPGDDDEANNRYTRAARFYKQWRDEGVLTAEADPAIYVYHQEFTYAGTTYVRRGFMARQRLTRFGEGQVFPHEETLPAAKVDRLMLTVVTKANLSPIFGLYPDPECEAQNLLDAAVAGKTPLVATDHLGVVHRLWPVTDVAVISQARGRDGPEADLHRRRPPPLRDGLQLPRPGLRQRLPLARTPGQLHADDVRGDGRSGPDRHAHAPAVPRRAAADDCSRTSWPPSSRPCFTTRPAGEGPDAAPTVWEDIETGGDQGSIGLYTQKDGRWLIATLTDAGQARMAEVAKDHTAAWQALGVSLLHRLIVDDLLGCKDLPKPTYVHLIEEVVDGLRTGEYPLAAVVMPATVEDVRTISLGGERMPAKSTYFYPKLLSGLVINPLE